jgi:hypothetical protein
VTRPRAEDPRPTADVRSVTLKLDGFAWEAIEEEAGREGVSVEELITFSALYYLADVDSGRISRRISASPYGGESARARANGPDRSSLRASDRDR